MAWVSVHESVLCAKLREMADMLNRPFGEALGILVILWLWGLQNADEYGYIRSKDEDYLGNHLYYQNGDYNLKPQEIVDSLIKTGWIEKEDGKPLRLHDWEEWQKEWYRYKSRLKSDSESKKRMRAKNRQDAGIIKPEAPEQGPVEIKPTLIKDAYTPSFLDVWNIYPRKDDKGPTFKKYQARLKEGYSEADLLMAAQGYANDMRHQGTEKRYILNGKTFFGADGRFIQYLPQEPEISQSEDLFSQFADPEDDE